MSGFGEMWPHLYMKAETERLIEAAMPQYLFYEPHYGGKRGERVCKCSACGGSGVFTIKGNHKSETVCPMCSEPVTLIAHSKYKNGNSLTRHIPAVWFVAGEESLWAVGSDIKRRFERNSWDGPDWDGYLDITPYEVYQFSPGAATEWKCGWVYYTGWKYEWYQLVRPREPIQQGGMNWNAPDRYYLWQTDEIFKSPMRYSGVEEFMDEPVCDGEQTYGIIKYLTAYCERPKLELVVKWGLDDVASDFVWGRKTNGHTVNWKGNTPWEFLKIQKADWSTYRISPAASLALLTANRQIFRLPRSELLALTSELGRIGDWVDAAKEISQRGVPLPEQIKYIGKQEKLSNRDPAAWLRLWNDYLDMAENLGRDVSLEGAIMPRDLQQAHDDMVELRWAMQERADQERYKKQNEKYAKRRKALEKKYSYQSGELMIRVPGKAEEIVREGNVLKICVGGYAARHLAGSTTILFLRRCRKPDTPYVCIEIDDKTNEIRQIHGYRNERLGNGKKIRSPAEKFKPFLNEWLAWVAAGSRTGNKSLKKEMSA